MEKPKANVLIALFCYAGNGGVRMVYHELAGWLAKTYAKMLQDERVGNISILYPGDVPLTMERNRVVRTAKEQGYDVVWMIDNDNLPDLYVGRDPGAKEFWESSFEFVYNRLLTDLPSVVVAPYCGPPAHPRDGGWENVYVFYFESRENAKGNQRFAVEAYSRQQAALLRGIQSIAAGPTGCAMYSTSAFDLMPIRAESKGSILDQYAVGKIDQETALRRLAMDSWFFYEFTDQMQTKKASTEDVTNTREIQLAGYAKYKTDIVFCNWDSWAGHAKPAMVGKPQPIYTEEISEQYIEAVKQNLSVREQVLSVSFDISPVDSSTVTSSQRATGPLKKSRQISGLPVTSVGPGRTLPELEGLADVVRLLKQERKRRLRIVELGSWCGESAVAMRQALGDDGGEIFCVDHFLGDMAGDFSTEIVESIGGPEALRKIFDRNTREGVRIREADAEAAADELPDNQEIDLLVVDVDPGDMARCVRSWMRHLSELAWVIGFSGEDPLVQQTVAELFPQQLTRLFQSGAGKVLWLVANTRTVEVSPQ